jgi:hypothetical protein
MHLCFANINEMTNNGRNKVDFGLILLKLMKIDMFQNSKKEPKKSKVENNIIQLKHKRNSSKCMYNKI